MNQRKNISAIIIAITMAFATSCNSIDYRKADAIAQRGGASIQGLRINEGQETHVFSMAYIDGKTAEKPGYPMVHEITTGKRTVGVLGEMRGAKFGRAMTLGGQAEIKFTAMGGHKYELRGTISQDTITFHIFDLTDDKVASETVTVITRTMEQRRVDRF